MGHVRHSSPPYLVSKHQKIKRQKDFQ